MVKRIEIKQDKFVNSARISLWRHFHINYHKCWEDILIFLDPRKSFDGELRWSIFQMIKWQFVGIIMFIALQ